jgi:RNA polymerase sigma-70 factor (ECF subfamily)
MRAPPGFRTDERELIEALRRRDEAAFEQLVDRYAASLIRLARSFVGTQAVAEEVVQETWLGVLQGIDHFEARSSFKTWLFRILVNRARTRGEREGRTAPVSDEPAVDPTRFHAPDHDRWPRCWCVPPEGWGESPEERLLAWETRDVIERAIAALPAAQRQVITLRDIQGLSAAEVCIVLAVSDANQRVLLHRARSRVRAVLEAHLR